MSWRSAVIFNCPTFSCAMEDRHENYKNYVHGLLTTPEGGEGTGGPGSCGASSIGVNLLPDGGREDSPSDW